MIASCWPHKMEWMVIAWKQHANCGSDMARFIVIC